MISHVNPDPEFTEDDMRHFGDFRYEQGYADCAKEAAQHRVDFRCPRNLLDCVLKWDCIDRRRN